MRLSLVAIHKTKEMKVMIEVSSPDKKEVEHAIRCFAIQHNAFDWDVLITTLEK